MDDASASNAANPLTIPTYDGSGVCVHPDVVDAGEAGWNGYRYWMAMTPYPGTNNDYENPSVVASNDKTTWVVPDGLTNPVVPFPGGSDFNNDPDLVLVDDTMYLFYQISTNNSSDTEIYYRTSTDGVTWSDATHIELPLVPVEIKSPAFVREPNGWTLFYGNGALFRCTCATLTGTWSSPLLVYNQGTLSHVDVTKSNDVYYALLHHSNGTLRFAASWNGGVTWYVKSDFILSAGAAGHWTDQGFYRSTIQRTATGFDLWYSGIGSLTSWRIGYTSITYSDP